ncbi:hypothetical protein [Oceanobacter sp. 3_MG-2023]|uniref:hypothetical protein n=1 Tax=Oceanobacter sp. 3_MG-2023 TaxID=3062622 RepID=UPI0027327101|nr:hypothetical protein [Oceanobacter sp. 3_MG-2023]MDP2506888.1 hypothetical protein [Oceanobacter sp. 3_MG-2023]
MTNKPRHSETDIPRSKLTPERIFWGMLIVTAIVIIGYLGYFFGYLKYVPSTEPGDWGTFGDFVGGLVNPMIGLAGLYMLVSTLRQNQRVIEQAEDSLHKMQTALDQSQHALEVQRAEFELTRKEHEGSREAQEQLARTNVDNLKLNIAVNRIDRLLTAEKTFSEQVNWIFDKEIKGDIFIYTNNKYSKVSAIVLGKLLARWQKEQHPIAISTTALEVLTKLFEVIYQTLCDRNTALKELISSYYSLGLDATFLKVGKIECLGEMLKIAKHNHDNSHVDEDSIQCVFLNNTSRTSNISLFIDQHIALIEQLNDNTKPNE